MPHQFFKPLVGKFPIVMGRTAQPLDQTLRGMADIILAGR